MRHCLIAGALVVPICADAMTSSSLREPAWLPFFYLRGPLDLRARAASSGNKLAGNFSTLVRNFTKNILKQT